MKRVALTMALAALAGCGGDDGADASLDAAGEVDASDVDAGQDAGDVDAARPIDAAVIDDRPWKGPFTLGVETDRVIVRWESRIAPREAAVFSIDGTGTRTRVEGTSRATEVLLEYGRTLSIIREPDEPGTFFVNEVELTGLTPGTCYTYELANYADATGRVCTLRESDDTSTQHIYAIGDTSPAAMGTLRLLEQIDPRETDFTIHVGDLQYYSTILESQQSWFRLMQPLLRANAFMPCLGNHESELPHELEDIYLRLFDHPSRDGTTLWYHYTSGGVHYFSLSSEHDITEGSEQHAWFVAKLAEVEATTDYRFSVVYLHRPIYSVGDYGINDTLRTTLEPIFRAHRVPLVLAGHMHGYERFEVPTPSGPLGGITYVTTGAGGFRITEAEIDQNVANHPDDARLRMASGNFLQAMLIDIEREADGDHIRGRTLDDLGMMRDTFDTRVPLPTTR